jgi:hypothetical protein
MTITIDNLIVSNDAPAGTVIGVLSATDPKGNIIPCNYTLTKGSIGYFAISGDTLVTAWKGSPALPGHYSVRVRAMGIDTRFSGSATFTVTVAPSVMMPPPPPPPAPPPPAPMITVNGSANPVVTEGAMLAISVSNGPGNRTDWVGLAAAGAPDTAVIAWTYLSGSQTQLPDIGVTTASIMLSGPTVDGSYEARFYANDGWTVLARTGFTVVASPSAPPQPPTPAPPPSSTAQPVITVTPETPVVPDTTPPGTVVATYEVAMSDGSPFTGTVRFGAPFYDAGGIFAISGKNIIVNPAGPGIGPTVNSVTDHITLEAIP